MLGNHLFTACFELACDRRPGIVRVDERAARVSKRLPPDGIAEQPDHRVRKVVRCVSRHVMAARFERKAFGHNHDRHPELLRA